MPKFIGNDIDGVEQVANNMERMAGFVRVTFSQAARLPAVAVRKSLDTTDKGGRKSFAKRWYRWFALGEVIATSDAATDNMRQRAGLAPRTSKGAGFPRAVGASAAVLADMLAGAQ